MWQILILIKLHITSTVLISADLTATCTVDGKILTTGETQATVDGDVCKAWYVEMLSGCIV